MTPSVEEVVPVTPVLQPAPAPAAPVQVLGARCKNSHFNDPEVAWCAICGIAMVQTTRRLERGNRPALGVLVLDDGTTLALSRDLVLGRAPEWDVDVASGLADTVALRDPTVSTVHATLSLRDWEVSLADAGSATGTFVCAAGEKSWTRLPTGGSVSLRPGIAVALGRRMFSYHSHRAFRK